MGGFNRAGAGETQIEVDRIIRKRFLTKEKLKSIDSERQVQSKKEVIF